MEELVDILAMIAAAVMMSLFVWAFVLVCFY